QVRGQSVDRRSDLFNVGVVLAEMLSGRPAFTRATAADTMAAILNEDVAVAADVPPTLQQIVRHLVEKEPRARFQSAHDLAFDLSSLPAIAAGSRRSA